MTCDESQHERDGPELVPDRWPAIRTDVPSPVRTLRGLVALPGMILLWFFPKTIGVRLAASGWRAAIAAHLLGLTIGPGLIVWAELYYWSNPAGMTPVTVGPSYFNYDIAYPAPEMSWSECAKGPFAALTTMVHASTSWTIGLTWGAWLLLAVEGVVLLLAVALMPYAAAGESARALFGRCVRLAWWSTTMWIPLGIGWLLNPVYRRWLEIGADWHAVDFVALSAFALWWLFVLLRSGGGYAGPASGPAWETRKPRCERCGYVIALLPVETNCPECGRPVADSMPGRRLAPAFVAANGIARTVWAYGKTARAAISDRHYFERLAVHRDQAMDRMLPYSACALTAAMLAIVASNVGSTDSPWAGAAVVGSAGFVVQIIMVGVVATIASVVGRRSVQASAIVTFHALILAGVIVLGVLASLLGAGIVMSIAVGVPDEVWGTHAVAVLIIALGALGVGGYVMVVGLLRLARAFRQTRWASA